MNNQQIVEVFENIAGLLDIKGEPRYTVIAYQRAARTIDHLPTQMEQMVGNGEDLKEIPGIGRALEDKIKELVDTGQLRYYEKLRSEFPDGILDVMRVPGVGPKTASRLWDELGVSTVPDLQQAIGDGSVTALPRLGKKKAENILREIRSTRTKDDRVPIARGVTRRRADHRRVEGTMPKMGLSLNEYGITNVETGEIEEFRACTTSWVSSTYRRNYDRA